MGGGGNAFVLKQETMLLVSNILYVWYELMHHKKKIAVIRDLFVLNSEAKADFEAKWHLVQMWFMLVVGWRAPIFNYRANDWPL